jgi:YHS domain-containing protein
MVRLGIFLLLVILLYNLLRNLVKKSASSHRSEEPVERQTAEMVMDPQCGTYVLPAQGVAARVNGRTYHFCSEECRDKFIREHS